MMRTNANLSFVGNLQVYSSPYASLYVDKDAKSLCVFVRVSQIKDPIPTYAVATVSKVTIGGYLEGRLGLKSMFFDGKYRLARISEDNRISYIPSKGVSILDKFHSDDLFDSEFCQDEPALHCFLNSL